MGDSAIKREGEGHDARNWTKEEMRRKKKTNARLTTNERRMRNVDDERGREKVETNDITAKHRAQQFYQSNNLLRNVENDSWNLKNGDESIVEAHRVFFSLVHSNTILKIPSFIFIDTRSS